MGDAIKYLYSQFILRDVFSFITPGGIFLLSAMYVYNESFSISIHWLFYIPLFGLAFVIGVAIQCFGEMIRVVTFVPYIRPNWSDIFQIFGAKWRDHNNPIAMKKAYKKEVEFWDITDKIETAQQGRERLVVFMQTCINCSLAVVIAVVPYAISHWSTIASQIVLYGLIFVLIVSLFWGHRVHMLRRYNREEVIVSYYKSKNSKK